MNKKWKLLRDKKLAETVKFKSYYCKLFAESQCASEKN